MELNIEQLKQIAEKLNFKVHHLWKEETIKARLEEECERQGTTLEEVAYAMDFKVNVTSLEIPKEENDKIERLRNLTFNTVNIDSKKLDSARRQKDANRLIRCIITCNDPQKQKYQSGLFTASNGRLPEIKQCIPFGRPWHVSKIIFNMIKEKQLQAYTVGRDKYGNETTVTYLKPQYNIQVLDPITSSELQVIRENQIATQYKGGPEK